MSKVIANAAASRKRKVTESESTANKAAKADTRSDCIYVGHLPPGFYEREIRKFFEQFGVVQKLKLFRSKKTNNSKGYAFVKFESADVAVTVSQAVDGYHISDRQLISHVIDKSKLHSGMFLPPKLQEVSEHTPNTSDEVVEKRFRQKFNKKLASLRAAGIEYDITSVSFGTPDEKEALKSSKKEAIAKVTEAISASVAKKGGKVAEPKVEEKVAAVKATKTPKKADKVAEPKVEEKVAAMKAAKTPKKADKVAEPKVEEKVAAVKATKVPKSTPKKSIGEDEEDPESVWKNVKSVKKAPKKVEPESEMQVEDEVAPAKANKSIKTPKKTPVKTGKTPSPRVTRSRALAKSKK